MLSIALAPEDGDARDHRFLDLVEPARLIAFLSKSKDLPFVEISRHVEVEAFASQHGPIESAPAPELQGEGLEEAHGVDVLEGGGLAPVPVPRRGRFLDPSSGEPHLGIDHASSVNVICRPPRATTTLWGTTGPAAAGEAADHPDSRRESPPR